jgi:hypothetical protein
MPLKYAMSFGVILVAVAISAALSMHLFSRSRGPAIYVNGTVLVVENQTRQPWHDVRVTINAYYQGRSPTVDAGGRLEAPLSTLVSGFGYRFNTAREHVMTVEVHATDAGGRPVALKWDEKSGMVGAGEEQGK